MVSISSPARTSPVLDDQQPAAHPAAGTSPLGIRGASGSPISLILEQARHTWSDEPVPLGPRRRLPHQPDDPAPSLDVRRPLRLHRRIRDLHADRLRRRRRQRRPDRQAPNIVPFIATLATGSIIRGIGLIISNSRTPTTSIMSGFVNGRVHGVPVTLLFFAVTRFDFVLRLPSTASTSWPSATRRTWRERRRSGSSGT